MQRPLTRSAARQAERDAIALLRHVEVFQGLAEKELRRLAGLFEEQRLDQGEVLFRQGSKASRLYLVRDGFVEVQIEDPTGDHGGPRTLVRLGRGQSVGEMSLVDRGTRSATIRGATPDTVVVSAPFDAIDGLAIPPASSVSRSCGTSRRISPSVSVTTTWRRSSAGDARGTWRR